MKNIEKYKDEIKELDYRFAMKKGVLISCDNVPCYECEFCVAHYREDCTINKFKWLSKEYDEHDECILNGKEKRIVLNIIDAFKSFDDEIERISKHLTANGDEYYLVFDCKYSGFNSPIFTDSELFENMELVKDYTLKELGL